MEKFDEANKTFLQISASNFNNDQRITLERWIKKKLN